jgi:hypothetical protein
VGQDGNVWITNVTGNEVTELNAQGRLVKTFADARNPEGIIQLPAGQFALAEQRSDRVVVFDPVRNTKQVWVQLTANGNLGVDGLGLEPGMLLLPDAAQGQAGHGAAAAVQRRAESGGQQPWPSGRRGARR